MADLAFGDVSSRDDLALEIYHPHRSTNLALVFEEQGWTKPKYRVIYYCVQAQARGASPFRDHISLKFRVE